MYPDSESESEPETAGLGSYFSEIQITGWTILFHVLAGIFTLVCAVFVPFGFVPLAVALWIVLWKSRKHIQRAYHAYRDRRALKISFRDLRRSL